VAPCTEDELRWGGRSLIAHLMLREVRPTCDPLGRENKLIVAAGWLGDTSVTTAGRCSVGGKSPLTGGVKEANVGGVAGVAMARLGVRALVLEDAPDTPESRVLWIGKDKCEFLPAPELRRAEVARTFELLRDRFGERAGVFCVGPAGEMGLGGAAVATTDQTGIQARFAARGGLGAVMGVKGIKAIVLDDKGATPERAHDAAALGAANKELWQFLRDDPKTQNRHDFGTPAVLSICDSPPETSRRDTSRSSRPSPASVWRSSSWAAAGTGNGASPVCGAASFNARTIFPTPAVRR